MSLNILTAASAAAALLSSAPVFAQSHGQAGGAGSAAGMHSQGPMNASPTGIDHANQNSVLSGTPGTTTDPSTQMNGAQPTTTYNPNSPAAQNSQGPQNASPTGVSNANQNSVLARGAVGGSSLTGLTTGLAVNNSSGTKVGTVTEVVTGSDGSVRQVIVTGTDGKTYRLAPDTLSISGGVVTTTSTSISG